MATFTKLSVEEALARGIRYSSKISDTGELRARLTAADIDVTVTEVPPGQGGWQNSHSHERVVEITTVIRGRIVHVEQDSEGLLSFQCVGPGQSIRTVPGKAHVTLVFPDSVLSTVKLYDSSESRDWHAEPSLDALVTYISFDEALARAESN